MERLKRIEEYRIDHAKDRLRQDDERTNTLKKFKEQVLLLLLLLLLLLRRLRLRLLRRLG